MKTHMLICGGTGFIGRNLIEYFVKSGRYIITTTWNETKPDRIAGVKYLRCNLTDRQALRKAVRGQDIVLQAAATTSGAKDIIQKPYYHVTDNVIMNALLFRSAYEEHVKHVVFLSCTTMYASGDKPVKESDFDANREMYPSYFGGGWTKVYNEKMCEFYSRIGTTRFTVVRHSNIYGPYDKYDLERSHVFGATITKVMTAPEGGTVVVWGEGRERRDLLHVSDLVRFVDAALTKQKTPFELFNVGLGRSIAVRDLVRRVVCFSGRRLNIKFDTTKPTLKTNLCLDCSKARKLLGWKPQCSLDQGIRDTIQWWGRHVGRKGKA